LERFSAGDIRRLEGAAPVLKPATYLDLYSALSNSAGFIGLDSGPSHLAGMLGLPTLVIFGPSDPAVWQPIGPKVAVLRHLPLAELSADEALSVVKSLF
jgi:ADP-heptose:LPS heptosyltransferase